MADHAWTLPEIAEIAGVDYRTAHNWLTEHKLFAPSIRTAPGSGSPNLFNDDDLAKTVTLAALRPLLTIDGLRLLFPSPSPTGEGE